MSLASRGTKNETSKRDYYSFLQGESLGQPSSLLLFGDAKSGKTTTLADFLYRGLKEEKENALFITFADKPDHVLEKLKEFNRDFDKLAKKNRILFLDASAVPNCKEVGVCDTMSPLLERLKLALSKNDAKRVVIDGLEQIFTKVSDKKIIREAIYKIVDLLRDRRISYIIGSEKSPFLSETNLEKYLADVTIEIKAKRQNQRSCQVFQIVRIKNRQLAVARNVFEIGSDGMKVCSANSKQVLV